jgi:hypothetical protein
MCDGDVQVEMSNERGCHHYPARVPNAARNFARNWLLAYERSEQEISWLSKCHQWWVVTNGDNGTIGAIGTIGTIGANGENPKSLWHFCRWNLTSFYSQHDCFNCTQPHLDVVKFDTPVIVLVVKGNKWWNELKCCLMVNLDQFISPHTSYMYPQLSILLLRKGTVVKK